MAKIVVEDDALRVRLGLFEKIGALHGDLRVPLSTIREIDVADTFVSLRGIRAPGTGLPGVIALGTWRYRGGRDFAALYAGQRAG